MLKPAPGDPSPSGQAPDGQTQAAGAAWVQLDEPALAADRTGAELEGCAMLYRRLGSLEHRPALLVSTYFGEIGDAFPVLAACPVEAIGPGLTGRAG